MAALPAAVQMAKPEPKRRSKRGLELADWEEAGQLGPTDVDARLWAGAAAQGWKVLPKYRGANEKSHWC